MEIWSHLSIFLLTTASVMWVALMWLLGNYPMSVSYFLMFGTAGMMSVCALVFGGVAVRKIAKYKCGLPYSSYANSYLKLYDDTLEYIYWQVDTRDSDAYRQDFRYEDKFVYKIRKADIRSLYIQDDICSICGKGQIELPEWLRDKRKETADECTDFSFIMAFEEKYASEASEILNKWKIMIPKQAAQE